MFVIGLKIRLEYILRTINANVLIFFWNFRENLYIKAKYYYIDRATSIERLCKNKKNLIIIIVIQLSLSLYN